MQPAVVEFMVARVHGEVANEPVPLLVKPTDPVGVVAPDEVSFTFAVQEVP